MTSAPARELDILLLGATGFTGGLVAHELAARLAHTRLRWGIAGRDATALERVAGDLPDRPRLVQVDVTDPAALRTMAARTRVLVTTVGPYARLGVDVARACAEQGTHYADITGEEGFVRTLEAEVAPIARRTGATMVVCCGFDSVPHDLGVRFAVSHLPAEADIVLRGYVRARGRLSGGTARTALDTLAGPRARSGRASARTSGSADGPASKRAGTEHPSDAGEDGRPVGRLVLGAHRPERLGGWAIPLPTIDPLIVLRSAKVLPGYGATFNYGHFAHVRRTTTLVGAGATLGAAALAARTRPGRAVLERLLPSPGEGPDEAARAAGHFTVLLVGAGYGPTPADDVRILARVRGGDPGYGETSRMLAAAALTLASDERPDVVGVVTPAVGLGLPYQRRLEAGGMRFELIERDPASDS